MNFNQALDIACDLRWQMRPYCHRVDIAGSVARMKPEVGDIELVCIAKWEDTHTGSLIEDDFVKINRLHQWAMQTQTKQRLRWIKTGTQEILDWTPNPAGKWWKCYLPEHDLKVDVFICEPETFGYTLALRTGSGTFNRALAAHGLNRGTAYTVEAMRGCMSERAVFERLGLAYVPPWERTGPEALKVL